jgi:hypothetical protein
MPIVTWTEIRNFIEQAGEITAPWLLVVETIRGATHLQITATGDWTAMAGLLGPCGPDGLAGLTLPADRIVLQDAPPAALIGRIGGSSASLKTDNLFVIGRSCVVPVPAVSIGPLFVSFNIIARPVSLRSLNVVVSGATPTI